MQAGALSTAYFVGFLRRHAVWPGFAAAAAVAAAAPAVAAAAAAAAAAAGLSRVRAAHVQLGLPACW